MNHQWVDHVNQADYHGGWDVLPLRCLSQNRKAHPILQAFSLEAEDDWIDLPLLLQAPAIAEVLAQLDCSVQSARLMRLKAGAVIKPHRDRQLSIEYGKARLHLPIYMGAGVEFWCDGYLIPMEEGQLWYFNADKTHSVRNDNNVNRVNLVIDCIANDWLKNQIVDGAF